MKQMYEPIIGIEVHVELNTKSKMFCSCSADYFGKKPNTHTCPVCLGLPGALPYINQEAIKKCVQIGLALGCNVSEKSLFERKNYFYPDLSKGYQISQYRWPLSVNGKITLDNGDVIRINRAHQEEDTGKLTHLGSETLIDFNRSGVPLVEIVTEPDFRSSESVREYAQKLQQIFRYLGVSNADMERGDMRLEANVSVREQGQTQLPNYRVELKNINSFRFMVAAIEFEIKRQTEALEKGEKLIQETRGWDEEKKCTYSQRSKEEAHDYRYFPEPDLPELLIDKDQIKFFSTQLPELPDEKAQRFQEKYGLSRQQAVILVGSKTLAGYFEKAVESGSNKGIGAVQVANNLINKKIDIEKVSPEELIKLLGEKEAGIVRDEGELLKMAQEIIRENPKIVEDFKKGKGASLQVLIGAGMKKTAGKVDAVKLKAILEQLLKD